MPRALVLALVWLAGTLAVGAGAAAATPADEPADQHAGPTTTVNEFLPAERDLSDCISVLPKPGCGSEARGGPYQAAVFGAVVVGLGIIGTRIVVAVRRRDSASAAATAERDGPPQP